jgi:hypothetical protein
MRNLYYFDPVRIDLSKLRAEAQSRRDGDYRTSPEETVIHFHGSDSECTNYMHERYTPGAEQVELFTS